MCLSNSLKLGRAAVAAAIDLDAIIQHHAKVLVHNALECQNAMCSQLCCIEM
jgi:hypothetical protein